MRADRLLTAPGRLPSVVLLAIRRVVSRVWNWTILARAELLTGVAFVLGWALLTWGLAALTGIWQVWPLSAGSLLIAAGGIKLFGVVAWNGLYALTREPGGGRG